MYLTSGLWAESRVPTHTGKPGKMREVFPVREKSGNFRISPESQGIFYQSGKSQGKLDQKIILLFYGESLKTDKVLFKINSTL